MSAIVVKHRRRGRAATPPPASPVVDLTSPEAQPVIARIGAAICPFSPIDRVAHAEAVAVVALHAKRFPTNPFVEASL